MEKKVLQELQLWGGLECTINRIGDSYMDQLQVSNFYDDPNQLDAVISLGIKTVRFPVLWEKHAGKDGVVDWSWAEMCLKKFKDNNINPIAGLLHHGSGPGFTDLLDPLFPGLFSEYAAEVATRFPWITDYTPVNEPLTTARFSGLYGFWYPHKKNDVSFIKMLLNELKATVLAMQAIRKINPAARLVQTEDLAKTYSTPLLKYQSDFENNRRWLTWDILCGKLDSTHPLWNYFMRLGITKEELTFFQDNICPPDIIGLNYYITSERFLDENVDDYPSQYAGGNTLHEYADIEAVRVEMTEAHGLENLLQEVWQRYAIPLVITEAHLHCGREDQLRWLKEVFDIAIKIKRQGVDIRAVTAWALLGSFGWNKLLTSFPMDYETGAFDISAGNIRPTAIASFIKNIAADMPFSNPVIQQPGWWKRDSRFSIKSSDKKLPAVPEEIPLLIIGKSGTLGQAFARICRHRHIPHHLLGREDVDICNSEQIEQVINTYKPWAIINTAGYVKVDEAENHEDACYRANLLGVQKLAILCEKYKIRFVTFSTDMVFDGEKNSPYVESDEPNPLNTYGRSKHLAETFLKNVNPSALVIRTSSFFGPWDEYNFVTHVIRSVSAGESITIADDIIISPTYVPHLVHACLDLLIDNESGIWHLVNSESLTWYALAKKVITIAGMDTGLLEAGYNLTTAAVRPPHSGLTSEKYNQMPTLDDAITQYLAELPQLITGLVEKRRL